MGDLRKTFSGLWGPAESGMTLDEIINKFMDLKRKGAPGSSKVTFMSESSGITSEFGSFGQVTMSFDNGNTKITISLKS